MHLTKGLRVFDTLSYTLYLLIRIKIEGQDARSKGKTEFGKKLPHMDI